MKWFRNSDTAGSTSWPTSHDCLFIIQTSRVTEPSVDENRVVGTIIEREYSSMNPAEKEEEKMGHW